MQQCTHGLSVPGIFLLDAVVVVACSAKAPARGPAEHRAEQGTMPWHVPVAPAAAKVVMALALHLLRFALERQARAMFK